MRGHSEVIRAGDLIASSNSRVSSRLTRAIAIADERDAMDFHSGACRKVQYKHWTGQEWHFCDGHAWCFAVLLGPPHPSQV